MTTKKKLKLAESDSEQEAEEVAKSKKTELKINTKYAERYEEWRSKEELQKLKDKYGNLDNLEDGDNSSSDETEDEDAKEWTQDMEIEFFKALSMVKSSSNQKYDKETCKFFESINNDSGDNNEKPNAKRKDEKKTFYLKDLEREMILKKLQKNETDANEENNDIYEDDLQSAQSNRLKKQSYFEEQEAIKKSLKNVLASDDEDDEKTDFLKVKTKSKEDKEKEESDYIEWLKGKKRKIKDHDLETSMKHLHDYWNDPNLTESERYLRDFILNKRYLNQSGDESESDSDAEKPEKQTKSDKPNGNTNSEPLDIVDLSDEEKIIENQELFEKKYNFRFEEPDPEFIKAYPRTIADSARRKDTKRKEKREEYRKRKELEKQKKIEEIKRMKSLKRKEINEKLEKIKKITGNYDLKLDIDDLDRDFDPDEHEKKMGQVFNDDYYQQDDNELDERVDEEGKPIFSDDEEDLKINDWNEWSNNKAQKDSDDVDESNAKSKKKKKKKKKKNDDEDELEDPEFNMDCEQEDTETSKGRKKSKFAESLLKEKPIFDPNEKSFEEYFDEYYKLDCEDVIGGDLPCRFKYREVVPNDFGLEIDEILASKDSELNNWASLKKAISFRPIQEEIMDAKVYKNKKNNLDLKKKVLASMYNEDDQEEDEKEVDEEAEKQDQEVTNKKQENSTKKDKSTVPRTKNEKEKTTEVEQTEEKCDTANISKEKDKHKSKNKSKKKNKNIVEQLTDDRLLAYGINPKKFKKKIKYS